MLKERVITALIAVAARLLPLFAYPRRLALALMPLPVRAGACEIAAFLGSGSPPIRAIYVSIIAELMGLVTWQAP